MRSMRQTAAKVLLTAICTITAVGATGMATASASRARHVDAPNNRTWAPQPNNRSWALQPNNRSWALQPNNRSWN